MGYVDGPYLGSPPRRAGARLAKLAAVVIAGVLLGVAVRPLLARQLSALTAPPSAIEGEFALVHSKLPGIRVLFIGNSFTQANGMIFTLAALADHRTAAGLPIFPVEYAPGGSTLQMALADPRVSALIRSAYWNYVVLQEQSQVPELPRPPDVSPLPGADGLQRMIVDDGARLLLFETWGYRHGDLVNFPNDSYDAMQNRLDAGYALAASGLGATVVPVGDAWHLAIAQYPSLSLWAADDKHPSALGSYLTACEFFEAVEPLQATQTTYDDGLGPATVAALRAVADLERDQSLTLPTSS